MIHESLIMKLDAIAPALSYSFGASFISHSAFPKVIAAYQPLAHLVQLTDNCDDCDS
jgi:hypothetical protein